MTDKENGFEKDINVPHKHKPIYLDGVDVNKCEYFKDGMCYAECDLEGYTDWECKDAELSNCYFKQLARKTQECEELENKIKKLRKNLALEIETNDHYRKALEEIEKLISDDEFIRCPINDDANCNYFTRNKILDIINKARGEAND